MDCSYFGGAKALSGLSALKVDEVQEVQGGKKWIMAEVEERDEEEEGGGREKSRSPLGCSCRGSGKADVIHLIGSDQLRGISFSFTGPKVAGAALPVCCCLSKVCSSAFFLFPFPLCIFTPATFPLCLVTFNPPTTFQRFINGAFNRRSLLI